MLIAKNHGGPSKGISMRRQKGLFTAHAALTKGLAYPLNLTTDITDDLHWYKTAALAASSESSAIYVIPEADVASGDDFWGVHSGEVTAISAKAIGVGAELFITSAGKMTDARTTGGQVVAIALEAATGADKEFKIAFMGGGSGFSQDIGT